ncbi:MAG: hypothetical protein ACT4OM_09155 [Actinomycetota bacterium]
MLEPPVVKCPGSDGSIRWRFTGAALALGMLLSACRAPAEEVGSADQANVGGAFPVTIEHKYGSTTIATEPQRVVGSTRTSKW